MRIGAWLGLLRSILLRLVGRLVLLRSWRVLWRRGRVRVSPRIATS